MKRIFFRNIFILQLLIVACRANAQRNEILNDRIQSLTVNANGDWQSMPIYELRNGFVDIDFDDMTHEQRRYAYKIEHCDADWNASTGLFDSDFCQGFTSGNLIDDSQESLLTNTLYTHYHLRIPNEKCIPTISGNYRITVYDDNDDEKPVFTACFMVAEPPLSSMGVHLQVTGNTDATINTSHQQVSMDLSYGPYSVTNPLQQIHTVVLQNGRWDDQRVNARPQYVMNDGLRWAHNPSYIFLAGNEFHKFEILSTDVASMGIDRIQWDGSMFHAYPFVSIPRQHYIYDEDADGAFVIRNSNNENVNTESDYMMVHFQLECPEPVDGDVYVSGRFTNNRFLDRYRMEYDDSTHRYHTQVLMKLGYYNYQYLMFTGGKATVMPAEGSFYQTQNRYQAFVYFRETGGRTDRLVGFTETER